MTRILRTRAGSASAAVLSAIAVVLPQPALSQRPIGPLSTSVQNPLYRMLYVPEAETPDPVGEGALRIELSSSYSSVFEASNRARHAHLFDLEQMTNAFTVRYGIRPSFEVGARLGLYTGWDGFLDRFVSGFHDFFNLPNAGRENRPHNEYLFLLEHDDMEPNSLGLDTNPRSFALEDVRVHAKWRFHANEEASRVLSLRGDLRRAGGPLDDGRIDGAVSVHGRFSGESVHLHAATGLALTDAPRQLDPIARDRAIFFLTGLEYTWIPGLSLLAQISGTGSYFRRFTGGELDGFPLNIVFGLGGETEGGWGWQVSFAEDLIPSGPAVDFTVDVQLSRRFLDG